MAPYNTTWSSIRGLLFLVVLSVVVFLGWADAGYRKMGGNFLHTQNDVYLKEAVEKAGTLLIPVGLTKASLDVIEGSNAVVEWGDIVQPVLDYVGLAWRVLLAASVALLALRYFLQGTAHLGEIFLMGSVGLYLAVNICRRLLPAVSPVNIALKKLAAMALLVALLFYLVMPLAILGASHLSKMTTANLEQYYQDTFQDLAETFSLEDIESADGLLHKGERIKEKADKLVSFVQGEGLVSLGRSVVYLLVVYLLDGLIFPAVMLGFLIWLVRGALYPALGMGDTNIADEDMNTIRATVSELRKSRR